MLVVDLRSVRGFPAESCESFQILGEGSMKELESYWSLHSNILSPVDLAHTT
jgi:hypothetical protein